MWPLKSEIEIFEVNKIPYHSKMIDGANQWGSGRELLTDMVRIPSLLRCADKFWLVNVKKASDRARVVPLWPSED